MAKKYALNLTPAERAELEAVTKRGRASVRKVQKARVILLADHGNHGPAWHRRRYRRGGWWDLRASSTKTVVDGTHQGRDLVDDPGYAEAEQITLVCDNFNTTLGCHSTKSFRLKALTDRASESS